MKELRLVTELAPSVNHAYYTGHNGKRFLRADARKWMERTRCLVEKEVKKQGWVLTKDTKLVMDIMTYWKDKRRHDTHNSAKVLCDTLEGIVYEDDKMLLPRYIDFKLDRENPRLELVIYKFDENKHGWKYDFSNKEGESNR